MGVNGANILWCGMMSNQFRDEDVNETLAEMGAAQGEVASDGEDILGDGRAPIKSGDKFQIVGLTNPDLMNNVRGALSFSVLPGEATNFYNFAFPGTAFPDGGFPLGSNRLRGWDDSADVEDQRTVFSQTITWPTFASYIGPYVIQVLFRPDGTDRVFAQCIDLFVEDGDELPPGCTDIMNCLPDAFPDEITAQPLPEIEQNSGVIPTAPTIDPVILAVSIIGGVILMLICCFLCWYFCCKAEKDANDTDEPLVHPEHVEPSQDANDEDVESKSQDGGVVQFIYTDDPAIEQQAPEGPSSEVPDTSNEISGDGSATPEGSQGRVFHFRYVNHQGADDDASQGDTGPGL